MTWADFYLVCFLVGFIVSLLSVLLGIFHAFNVHVPGLEHVHLHLHHGFFHVGDTHVHGSLGDVNGATADAWTPHVSPFNFSTVMAFLAWFGAAGYLLTTIHYATFIVLLLSSGAGVVGAALVFMFLTRVLMRSDSTLRESDYRLDGLLGRVSSGIREGGTGEIIFSQEGVRRTCGARSEDGSSIEKGTEVMITRYENGIAYVRRWDEMAREAEMQAGR